MKKIMLLIFSILLLLSCITPVTALSDSRYTTVHYSVPATVVYKDYDGTSTTQKVEVGTRLKAPKAKGKPGCIFEGWKDEQTGALWDFTMPVTEHMTLTASYSAFEEDMEGNVPIGKGKFSVSIKVESHAADVSIGSSSKDILNMLIADGSITSEELEQIAAGASMEIVLVVKDGADTITAASKKQMQQMAKVYTIGQYLDISLIKYLTVNGETGKGQLISQTSGMITVSVKLSAYMINTDKTVERSYNVLRNHEGKVAVLSSAYHAAEQTLVFQTNLFSDYAIAYKDMKKSGQAEDKAHKSAASGTDTGAPETGDTSSAAVYAFLLLLSAAVMVVLVYKKRKKEE